VLLHVDLISNDVQQRQNAIILQHLKYIITFSYFNQSTISRKALKG